MEIQNVSSSRLYNRLQSVNGLLTRNFWRTDRDAKCTCRRRPSTSLRHTRTGSRSDTATRRHLGRCGCGVAPGTDTLCAPSARDRRLCEKNMHFHRMHASRRLAQLCDIRVNAARVAGVATPQYLTCRGRPVLTTPNIFTSVLFFSVQRNFYQKGKTSLGLNEARDDGFCDGNGISWTIMQTICKSLSFSSAMRPVYSF